MAEYLWTREASELLRMPSPEVLLKLRRRHEGGPKQIPGVKRVKKKGIDALRWDRELLMDWASKHYKTTSHAAVVARMRASESREGTITLFPDGLDVTKAQGRNLAALGDQWRCSSQEALQRLLNIQGHALGRAGAALEDGTILAISLNQKAAQIAKSMSDFQGRSMEEAVFFELCHPENPTCQQLLSAMRFDNR